MLAIPLTILALAAGVYLLIHVKQSGLGPLYKYLGWLVVVLSLLFIVCCVVRGARHNHRMEECHMSGQCGMSRHGEAACPYMKSPACCAQGGSCNMQGGHAECNMGAQGCCAEKGGDDKAPCCMKDGQSAKASCCTKGPEGSKNAADSAAKK